MLLLTVVSVIANSASARLSSCACLPSKVVCRRRVILAGDVSTLPNVPVLDFRTMRRLSGALTCILHTKSNLNFIDDTNTNANCDDSSVVESVLLWLNDSLGNQALHDCAFPLGITSASPKFTEHPPVMTSTDDTLSPPDSRATPGNGTEDFTIEPSPGNATNGTGFWPRIHRPRPYGFPAPDVALTD